MSLHLPDGKKVAVSISADFDAHAAWKGAFDRTSPSYLSRGEFGAEVGVPRLLELFARYDVQGDVLHAQPHDDDVPAADGGHRVGGS